VMSVRLRDLIKAVRSAKTAAEERSIIQKEAALIRTEFSKGTAENRQRNIAKLLYMNTLGYPTKWGQMECIKLIASSDYTDKRIGYLAINLMLDETSEVLMLATHQIKTDMLHHQKFISGLALNTLGNIASEQICRDCACDVEKLLNEPDAVPYRKKKAVLCALKIIRKVPDLAEQFVPCIKGLLQTPDHGVLLCTATFMIELCRIDPAYKKTFQEKYVGGLVRILKSIHKAGYAPEYDVGNISDPFLQVRILQLLRILGDDSSAASEKMNEVLAMVATNTDTLRNVGNAILYECVNTIMAIKSDQDLRVMAVNTLGKFLSNKDNNIRYVALFSLCKVVDEDTEAVQRDRGKIVDCLKDPDRSIRRRALHLIYSLVDANNVRNLVRELLAVLMKADVEFRSDLTAKLCYVSEKFAPDHRWFIDTILRVMSIAGEYVPEQIQFNLIATISKNPNLHSYAVQKMYLALTEDQSQDSLNQVSAWCIGEYGDTLVNKPVTETGAAVSAGQIVQILEKVLNSSTCKTLTKEYVLTALFKLSDRLGPAAEQTIKKLIGDFKTNLSLELQHRACEYSEFLSADPSKRKLILAPIPPLQNLKDSSSSHRLAEVASPDPVVSPFVGGSGGGIFTMPDANQVAPPPVDPAATIMKLFELTPGGSTAPTGPAQPPTDFGGIFTLPNQLQPPADPGLMKLFDFNASPTSPAPFDPSVFPMGNIGTGQLGSLPMGNLGTLPMGTFQFPPATGPTLFQ